MASAAPIALRTRKSQADSRVTLFTLDDAPESKSVLPSSSAGSSSPATRRTRNARVKAEAAAAAASSPSTPATPRKRARKSKVEAEEDEYSEPEEEEKKPRRPSLSPRKPTPTKLRPKLEHAHPEPPRWRETYEIVSYARWHRCTHRDLTCCIDQRAKKRHSSCSGSGMALLYVKWRILANLLLDRWAAMPSSA